MRIGHLASDLMRISSFSDRNAIKDIVEESKFFIEWTAPEASFEVQAVLSEIQIALALWQLRLLKFSEIEGLQSIAKKWSEQLLETSSLLTA